MPNAAATVLPWKRLPSVSEQITRSRISRSPAPNADSSRGPARTATTRPSPVRVTRSGHGSGMPGSCWSFMRASIPGEGHNRLTSRPHRGISFPSSQGVPARPRRLVAARSGTGEADRADPDLRARLDCRDLDIGHVAANPRSGPGFNQRLLEICDQAELDRGATLLAADRTSEGTQLLRPLDL